MHLLCVFPVYTKNKVVTLTFQLICDVFVFLEHFHKLKLPLLSRVLLELSQFFALQSVLFFLD